MQAADLLTKLLARARFVRLRAYLMGEARQVHSSSSSEDSGEHSGEQPATLQVQSTEFGPHNATDGDGEAEAELYVRCASPDDSGSPFATQWRAAEETEMEAISRSRTRAL